jgi:hypothetical protein
MTRMASTSEIWVGVKVVLPGDVLNRQLQSVRASAAVDDIRDREGVVGSRGAINYAEDGVVAGTAGSRVYTRSEQKALRNP